MTKLEAYKAKALAKLGWLGKYTYEELCITEQIHINEMVEEMILEDRAKLLLQEAELTLTGCMGEDE